jgi:transcriptional regulator with XRE-family HTH domain
MGGLGKRDNEYVPIDGFHRLNAIDWLAKQSDIPVDLEHVAIRYSEFDTMADAIIAAAGVNAGHGLKRKSGDIHATVRKLLEVDRMRFLKDKYTLNKAAIMEVVKCSSATYKRATEEVRKELTRSRNFAITTLAMEGLTQGEISKRVGCAQATVSGVLNQKSSVSLSDKPKNEQQEEQHEEITTGTSDTTSTDNEDSAPSIFTHITEAGVVDCPWETDEEQEEAPEPSFSETNAQARIRLFIEDLSEEDKAYALKLLSM